MNRYGVVKNEPCNPLIYKKYCNPEGQRFKSSPRNQLPDNKQLLPNISSLVYKSLDFWKILPAK